MDQGSSIVTADSNLKKDAVALPDPVLVTLCFKSKLFSAL